MRHVLQQRRASSGSARRVLGLFVTWVAAATTPVAPASAADPSTLRFSLPMLPAATLTATGASARTALPPSGAGQPALLVALANGRTLALPMAADTCIARDDDKPHGQGAVVLRDARAQQGLFKVDLTSLPANGAFGAAAFRFSIGWHEREGSGKIAFHRMLTDWTEEATGKHAGGPAGAAWANLRPGVDYEAAPFAVLDLPGVTNGVQRCAGFDDAIHRWRSGEWENHGFVAQFAGRAVQINISSRESGVKPAPALHLGGPDAAAVVLTPDLALLRRLLLQASDLREAAVEVSVSGAGRGALPILTLQPQRQTSGAGVAAPLARVSLATAPGASTVLSNVTAWLQQCLAGSAAETNLLLTVEGGASASALSLTGSGPKAPALVVTIVRHPTVGLFDPPIRPAAGVYATVQDDGHIYYGSRRLRLWGVNRHDAPSLSILDRLQKTGFNGIRLWPAEHPYDAASAARGSFCTPTGQVANVFDTYDRFVAEARAHGIFVLSPLLHARGFFDGKELLDGVLSSDSFLVSAGAGRSDWEAWRAAVRTNPAIVNMALYFDERVMLGMKRHADNVLNHVNPYTGRRYAEEESIAIWQVQNENGFVYKVLEQGVEKWPPYFQKKLQSRWNTWLKERYGDQAGLAKAWGKLGADETLAAAAIALEPTLLKRKDYPEARGNDLVGFLVDTVVAFNRDFHAHCRAQAPAGVGVNVVPFVFDCQYRPSIPWLASQALAGSAVSFGTYEWGLASRLNGPPGLYVMDTHTVAGCPTIVYETNTADTNPYRAEFPLRVAALASREDWDGVFFHIYHTPGEASAEPTPDEQYLLEKLPYIRPEHYWSGTHFSTDPALGAALSIAGQIFLSGAIAPASTPAIYRLSDAAIHSYRYLNGVDQRADAFSCGTRLHLGGVGGPDLTVERPANQAPDAGQPVIYDPAHGRMIIDTPTAKAYVGRTGGRYAFRDGLVIGDFSQPFVAWGLVSQDGRPLVGDAPTTQALVSAANNAANTGFVMDMSLARQSAGFIPPLQLAAAIHNYGRAPMIVDPVGWSLWLPQSLKAATLTSYDFALRQTGVLRLSDTNSVQGVADRDVFLYALRITRRGETRPVPAAREAEAMALSTGSAIRVASPTIAPSLLWNPLPGLNWADDYSTAHQKMRDGSFLRNGVSGVPLTDKPDASFIVSDAEVLFNKPANIEISFAKGSMARIAVTFTQPPPLLEVVAAYEQQFGKADEKRLTVNAFETSTVQWSVAAPTGPEHLTIALTESQGMMGLVFMRTMP